MRTSDVHWIGFPTAGSSRMSVGYAAKHVLQCGFVVYGCRIRSKTCPLVRVRHKRASNKHRGVRLGAGSSHMDAEPAPNRVPGTCSTSLCVICASGRASGACSVHTCVRYAPRRGTVFLHVVTASIGAALKREPLPAGLATGRQDQSHTHQDTPRSMSTTPPGIRDCLFRCEIWS